jgi:hypothetical protein
MCQCHVVRFSTAFLWERLEYASRAATPVRNLAPEEVLPVLCVHCAKHSWEHATERAKRVGGVRMLYLGLFLAQRLLGAAVPANILRLVERDPVVLSLAARMRVWLFAGAESFHRTVEQHASYLKLEERVQDKMRCGVYLMYRLLARLVYYVISPRVWRPD